MSRVTFSSPHGEAELWGGERASCGNLVDRLAEPQARLNDFTMRGRWIDLSYARWRGDLTGANEHPTWVGVKSTDQLRWNGYDIDSFALILNTGLALGNDVVKFMARLHGQCEIHGWVDGPDRAWLAGLIQQGLDEKLLRAEIPRRPDEPVHSTGWDKVIELLRERDDEPVVTDYSVTDGFPNPKIAGLLDDLKGHEQDEAYDAWHVLPREEQWDQAMAGLRATGGGRQWRPENWPDFHFMHGLTVMDIVAQDWEQRLDAALSPDKVSS